MRYIVIKISLLLFFITNIASAQLPQDHIYQVTLRDFMGSLKEEDFYVELDSLLLKDQYFEDSDEMYRTWLMFGHDQNEMPTVLGLRHEAQYFTLQAIEANGTINMKTGRGAWLPVTETAFWADWNYPGNPHYDSRAVKLRAFVGAAVDLMMEDQLIESGDNRRSDFLGGNLIWWAYAYGVAKDVLPNEVKDAYENALIKMFQRIEEWGPTGINADMDSRALVSLQYVAKFVESADLQQRAFGYIDNFLSRFLKGPGYIDHGGAFDGSYNGISLYFLNWAARINEYQPLIDALNKMSELKAYVTLPDPDGQWFSPSHSNSSSQWGAANDQWSTYFRDVGIADFSEEASYLVFSEYVHGSKTGVPSESDMMSDLKYMYSLLFRTDHSSYEAFTTRDHTKPSEWSHNHWTNSSFDATSLYYKNGFYSRLSRITKEQKKPPFSREEDFVKSFGDKYLSVKHNGYGAIIFNDRLSWWTGEGDTKGLNGLGGGNLSAFWTPETGTVIMGVGRIRTGSIDFNDWEKWPIHAISGTTENGSSFSSGAQRFPEGEYSLDRAEPKVVVTGDLANNYSDPYEVLSGPLNYKRDFIVTDSGLKVTTSLTDSLEENVSNLYEILPVFLRHALKQQGARPTQIAFNVEGKWQEATSTEVKTDKIKLTRFSGEVIIELEKKYSVKLSSEDFYQEPENQYGAQLRNIMIDILHTDSGKSKLPSISYTIKRKSASQGGNGGQDTGGDQGTSQKPVSLSQNYPNPFNTTTTIEFQVPERQKVTLEVYDLMGRYIATIYEGTVEQGDHTEIFNPSTLSSGIYFYTLKTEKETKAKKMTFIK